MKSARWVALALVLAACSPAAVEETTTTSSSTTTTSTTTTTTTPTTTTTIDDGPISPLTGLMVGDPALLERRLLAVKIDNHVAAVPQSGVEQADVVFESMAEGVTRWMALFMESDAEYLGPMRSARPTDSHLLRPLNNPLLARSGAQAWVSAHATARDIHLIGEIGPPATFRISGRRSPHNLYVNTHELRNAADARGIPNEPPPPFWEFGPLPDDATTVSSVNMRFSATASAGWSWDEESSLWLRSAYGNPSEVQDQEGTRSPLGVPVLIALVVDYSMIPAPPGFWGTPVPGSEAIGVGQAFIFADGKMIEARWERFSDQQWFRIIDEDGESIPVPPGKAWVSLVSSAHGMTYEP